MQAKTGRAKMFYYYFAHVPPYPQGSPFTGWGAGHWAELRYVFDHLNQYQWAWSDADRKLANTMATYWTNFAKTGDPNGDRVLFESSVRGTPVRWYAQLVSPSRVVEADAKHGSGLLLSLFSIFWGSRIKSAMLTTAGKGSSFSRNT
jgi:carboxylesterase type B